MHARTCSPKCLSPWTKLVQGIPRSSRSCSQLGSISATRGRVRAHSLSLPSFSLGLTQSLFSHTLTHTYTQPPHRHSLGLLLSSVERDLRDLINYLLFCALLHSSAPSPDLEQGSPHSSLAPHAFPQHCPHSSPQQLPYSPSPPSPLRWLPALEPERLGRAGWGWGRGRGVVGAEPSAGAGPSAQSSPPYPWQHLHSISVTVL